MQEDDGLACDGTTGDIVPEDAFGVAGAMGEVVCEGGVGEELGFVVGVGCAWSDVGEFGGGGGGQVVSGAKVVDEGLGACWEGGVCVG